MLFSIGLNVALCRDLDLSTTTHHQLVRATARLQAVVNKFRYWLPRSGRINRGAVKPRPDMRGSTVIEECELDLSQVHGEGSRADKVAELAKGRIQKTPVVPAQRTAVALLAHMMTYLGAPART
ncbi:hypothetical protein J6590_012871 [Homalodisca vitripennis]|nr:hypothetical protein J6590_012871 [Homalodisca vitripennis]